MQAPSRPHRDRRERNRLVEEQIGLAQRIASDYRRRGIERDDLRQVALLGLVKAADRFDADRGIRFSAFASITINGEIKRHFRDHGWSVRPPRSVQEAYLDVRRAQADLSQELGRAPSVPELGDRCGLDDESVIVALDARACYRSSPLDAPTDDRPHREPGGVDAGFDRVEAAVAVGSVADELDDRERRILRLRFVQGLTQADIASQLGVSQVHVSRLLRQITGRLRDRMVTATT